jgi:hypothetical protein
MFSWFAEGKAANLPFKKQFHSLLNHLDGKDAPWRVLVSSVSAFGSRFRRYAEASSAGAGGSGLALFERSEFSQTPPGPSNAAYRRSRATHPARLSFASFSLAKQRKGRRPPGRDPASHAIQSPKH